MKYILNRIIFVVVLLFFDFAASFGQQLRINTTMFFGGGGSTYIFDMMCDDRDKSLIFCGSTDSSGSGDMVPKPAYLGNAKHSYDLMFVKMDSNKNILWVKMYGGTRDDGAASVKITSSGTNGYLIAGGTSSHDFDAVGNKSGGVGPDDFWLLRLDSGGNKLWHRCFGGIQTESLTDMKVTSDGRVVMIGYTNSPTSGDVPFTYVNSQFTNDIFIVKTDSLGNKQWAKTIGGRGDDGPANIYQLDNAYYVIVNSESTDHECNDVSWTGGRSTRRDIILIKLDSAGNYLWNKSYGGPGDEGFLSSVWDHRDSSFVFACNATVSGDFVPTPSLPFFGRTWVVKLKADGSVVWSRIMGDTTKVGNLFQYIQLASQGKGYIVAAEVAPDNQILIPSYFGGRDIHLFLIDSSGNAIIDKKMGGTGDERNVMVYPYQKGFIVTGVTNSTRMNEGSLLNAPRGPQNSFISFLDYWSLSAPRQSPAPTGDMDVYPNPAEREINVSLSIAAKGQLTLVTMDGKILYQMSTSKNIRQYKMHIKMLPPSNYMLHWKGENGAAISKRLAIL